MYKRSLLTCEGVRRSCAWQAMFAYFQYHSIHSHTDTCAFRAQMCVQTCEFWLQKTELVLVNILKGTSEHLNGFWENWPPLWRSLTLRTSGWIWGESAVELGNLQPILWETGSLGNWLSFWENWLGFRLFLGNNWLSFGVVLGQCSSETVLNAEHVWVLIVEVQAPGVSKDGSTGSKLEGN